MVGKTLCGILTVADAIPLPIASLRVDRKLSRHDFAWPSLQRAAAVPGADCYGVVAMPFLYRLVLTQKPCHPSMPRPPEEPILGRLARLTVLPSGHQCTVKLQAVKMRQTPSEVHDAP